jgi:DNA-binding helix-hairpin-helix protein with protein kinase domain
MPPLEDRPSLEARVVKLEARVAALEAAAQSRGTVTMRNGETWEYTRLTHCPYCAKDTADRYETIFDKETGLLPTIFVNVCCADCGQIKR